MIRPWRRGLQISLKAVCLLTLVIAAYGGGYSLARQQASESLNAERAATQQAEDHYEHLLQEERRLAEAQ